MDLKVSEGNIHVLKSWIKLPAIFIIIDRVWCLHDSIRRSRIDTLLSLIQMIKYSARWVIIDQFDWPSYLRVASAKLGVRILLALYPFSWLVARESLIAWSGSVPHPPKTLDRFIGIRGMDPSRKWTQHLSRRFFFSSNIDYPMRNGSCSYFLNLCLTSLLNVIDLIKGGLGLGWPLTLSLIFMWFVIVYYSCQGKKIKLIILLLDHFILLVKILCIIVIWSFQI